MGKKELGSMKKHRGLFLGLAVAALMSLPAGQARAEAITMSISIAGGPLIDLSTFGGVGTSNGYTMNDAAITALNAALTTAGSEYQFSTTGATVLGGTSNFPGSSQGQLTLSGTILSVGSGDARLTIVESESAFTSPTGPAGTLNSSSTGNFDNQPAGPGHTASSAFNTTSTPTYTVSSLTSGTNPGTGGMASAPLSSVPTLYTLTNTISFGLVAGSVGSPVVDGFSVIATVSAIPEPTSLVMMLTGMPVPLVLLGILRRRRASA
jgi:hypothetical protein